LFVGGGGDVTDGLSAYLKSGTYALVLGSLAGALTLPAKRTLSRYKSTSRRDTSLHKHLTVFITTQRECNSSLGRIKPF